MILPYLVLSVDMGTSNVNQGATASHYAPDEFQMWKGRDGVVPLLDHPALKYTAHRWERPPMFNLEKTIQCLQTGQIGPPDLMLTQLLLSWRCLTEKQIRYLARNSFNKGHEIGTRLRVLQKIGWFDGFVIDTPDGRRENMWMTGLAAHQYFELVEQVQGLQDPISMLQFKDYAVSLGAVNEFRLLLEERGHAPEVSYAPVWRKGDKPRPYSRFVVTTEQGPLTLYVERLSQKGKPISFMRKKLEMYEEMTKENGGALPNQGQGASMVVWSVGSIQSIQEIVGSMDYIPDSFFQAFLCDECLSEFPQAFFLATKGEKMGEVMTQPLQMDLL